MLSDAESIALALVAVWNAGKPESIERTCGYQQTEVLAAAFNALIPWVITGWIIRKAVDRFSNHHEMHIVGVAGRYCAADCCRWSGSIAIMGFIHRHPPGDKGAHEGRPYKMAVSRRERELLKDPAGPLTFRAHAVPARYTGLCSDSHTGLGFCCKIPS